MEKGKLIKLISKKAKISEKQAVSALECMLKEKSIFRKQDAKTVQVIKEVAVPDTNKTSVKTVEVI